MNVMPFRPETFLSNDQIGGEMTEKEIYVFIEKMKKYGDVWEYGEVVRQYGNKALEEAVADRKFDISEFSSITGMIIDEEDMD